MSDKNYSAEIAAIQEEFNFGVEVKKLDECDENYSISNLNHEILTALGSGARFNIQHRYDIRSSVHKIENGIEQQFLEF